MIETPPLFKLLLASDLHGSNAAYRKLIRLALHHEVTMIVIAGDWSGKHSLLVIKRPDGSADYIGPGRLNGFLTASEVDNRLEEWRDTGVYPVVVQSNATPTQQEFDELSEQTRALRLQQWL